MKKADRIFAVICMGLSLWLILEALRYDYMTVYSPGPGFQPFWLGVLLGLLALFLLFRTFRRKDDQKDDAKVRLQKEGLVRSGKILLVMAVMAFVMTRIGFIAATVLFIALILIVLEKYSIGRGVFYSVVLSGFIFLIFRYWLNVDLPKGWLGF